MVEIDKVETANFQIQKRFLVTLTVLLTLLSAVTLDFAAANGDAIGWLSLAMILAALSLNISKFLIWGLIHRRYRISRSYVLTAIFFPLVFLLGIVSGDTHFSFSKFTGVILIVIGIIFCEGEERVTE